MELKAYQATLLNAFESFLRRTRELKNPGKAFEESTQEMLGASLPYSPLPGAVHVPYVCLRVPTGGGKTRIAAQAIERFNRSFDVPYSLILWLVPSEPIRDQTLRGLRNPGELLHGDMRDLFGHVNVLDLQEALSIQPSMLNSANMVVVATMQSFKREDTGDLRVFRQNGALLTHFDGLSEAQRGDQSLVDVIRLHRPFVVVDEAHNQGSPLAVETIVRFDPSCVLELTATPDRLQTPSNVLRSVSASTLQAEDMLKLPLELAIHPQWRVALGEAIARLQSLTQACIQEERLTSERIKPVMLIQGERRAAGQETFTPETIKQALIADFHIDPSTIAIATGALDEVGDKPMTAADFPTFIITVDKLREGWDCPFAYVLFTFRGTTSSTAVEQILGRVLRMPNVKRKQTEALNRAYVYAVSDALARTVEGLRDGLVHSGFERLDTRSLIQAASVAATRDLFSDATEIVAPLPEVGGVLALPAAEAINELPASIRERLEISPEAGTLTVRGDVTDMQLRNIANAFPAEQAGQMRERLDSAKAARSGALPPPSASERGERFIVPQLLYRQGSLFQVFDETPLIDADWEVADFDSRLTDSEFGRDVEAMRRAQLSMSQLETLECDVYDQLDAQLALFSKELGWSELQIVEWLDRNLPFPYSDQGSKVAWLTAAVHHLLDRGFDLEELAYRKFRLRGALERKLVKGLQLAKQRQFDVLLATPEEFSVADSDDAAVVFEYGRYAYDFPYSGFIRLQKHFFPIIGNLKSQGQEFECAEFIANQLPEVDCWVRNVERKPHAFWLQTASDRFYPDFVVRLRNGKILVVEFKGANLAETRDTREKDLIGRLWASRSGGRCGFVMATNRDWSQIRQGVATLA